MAETAGLALGAISLGIQVCKGIITYADAVRGKTDDLKSLDQKAKTLVDILDLVSKTLQRIRATATSANSTTAVSLVAAVCRSTKSCESSLKELEGCVAKHADGCPVSSSTFRQKCGDIFKSFKYGFNQREVAEMEFKLAGVNSTLLVGLQSLNFDRAAEHSSHLIVTHQDLSSLSTSISTQQQESNITHQNTEQTLRKLEAMRDDTLKLGESLSTLIGAGMPGIHGHISDTSATLGASLDSLRGHVSDNSSVIVNRLDTLTSSIESPQKKQAVTTELAVSTQRKETCTETLAAPTARCEAVPTTKGEFNLSIQRFVVVSGFLYTCEAVASINSAKLLYPLQSTNTYGQSFAERVLSSYVEPSLPDTQLNSQDQTTCHSAGILPLLFRLQCGMRPHSIIGIGNCSASLELYLGELRDRQDRLKLLALSRRGPNETETFALNRPEALDFHIRAIISHIESQNVGIPSFLITVDHDDQIQPLYHGVIYQADDAQQPTVTSETTHVYAMPAGFVKALHSAGFRGFETRFPNGFSLFEHLIINPGLCRWGDLGMWAMVDWILKHTSDVSKTLRHQLDSCSRMHATPQPECPACLHKHAYKKASLGHILGSSFGWALGQAVELNLSSKIFSPKTAVRKWRLTAEVVSRSDMVDGTTCLCSPRGRTPFVYFLLGYLRVREAKSHYRTRDFTAYFERLLCTFGSWWDTGNYYTAFRLFTFDALEMEHDCDYSGEDTASMSTCASDAKKEDIRTSRFEEIMMELDALLTDTNEGELNWRSWFATWNDHIQRALAEIDGRGDSDDYRRNTIEVGVVWDKFSNFDVEFAGNWKRDARPDETEYWLNELDKTEYWLKELDEMDFWLNKMEEI